MNQCLLEVEVLEAPKIRYTQDNQTPIAEMSVRLEGLRPEDPAGELKVVGFGSLAQDLQNRVVVGQRLVVEGRLRMNTVARPDGVKEKKWNSHCRGCILWGRLLFHLQLHPPLLPPSLLLLFLYRHQPR